MSARILVADDDGDILELVALRLVRAGYEVTTAGDGTQALELALAERPDLAVLDVNMPGLNGVEVTARIRADETMSALPVILLTAHAQEADMAVGLAAGADEYLRKPFDSKELQARVDALLGRSGRA